MVSNAISTDAGFLLSLCGCGCFWCAHHIVVCVLGCFLLLQAFLGSVYVWEVSLRYTAYVGTMLVVM